MRNINILLFDDATRASISDRLATGYAPKPLGIRFDTRTKAGDIRFIPFDTYTLDAWVRGYVTIPLGIRFDTRTQA